MYTYEYIYICLYLLYRICTLYFYLYIFVCIFVCISLFTFKYIHYTFTWIRGSYDHTHVHIQPYTYHFYMLTLPLHLFGLFQADSLLWEFYNIKKKWHLRKRVNFQVQNSLLPSLILASLFCGLSPPRGSGITINDCPNRGCSRVFRETSFPFRSRTLLNASGIYKDPHVIWYHYIFQSCFANPPPVYLLTTTLAHNYSVDDQGR